MKIKQGVFMRSVKNLMVLLAVALVSACGGASSSETTSDDSSGAQSDKYLRTFSYPCTISAAPDNLNAALSVTYTKTGPTTMVGAWRIEAYQEPNCTGDKVVITPTQTVTFEGIKPLLGVIADKVTIQFSDAEWFRDDKVHKDIMYLHQNNMLYTGGDVVDSEGYPDDFDGVSLWAS